MSDLTRRLSDLERARQARKLEIMRAYADRARALLDPAEYLAYFDCIWPGDQTPSNAAINAGWKLDNDPQAWGIFCELHKLITGQEVPPNERS